MLRRRLPLARRHRPAAKRPRTYNFWESRMPAGVHATETNQFGVHEFMRLCRLIGAEPYLAANVGSGTPKEFHDWVSYCNAPVGTESLADERAANGDKEPFRVKYWGVGNESWGCGGDMKPGEYATQYRQFVTQFPVYVAAVPHRDRPARAFTRYGPWAGRTGFFEAMQGGHRSQVHGFSLAFLHRFPQQQDEGRGFQSARLVCGAARRAAHRSRDSRRTGKRWASTIRSTARNW